ncbi:MAG: efflux RND transporter permease subunit [Pseudomonadales bacterium]|nr:efflux RND transporter permease subunit [Pseudomonadales bacterium]
MNIPAFSIRHHVLTYMLSFVFILFGVISYDRIGLDERPEMEFPMLSVSTVLPGGAPSIVDASVTNIIEAAVNSIAGVEDIMSSSLPGVSVITVRFHLSKDIDVAFNEMQGKINEATRLLPDNVETPIVKKIKVGGTPIMWLSLEGDRTLQQLNLYAKNVVKKRLETVSGLGNIIIAGERERTIRVELDIQRMAGLSIVVDDVVGAFKREHIKLPGGFLVGPEREEQLKLDLEYHNLDELKNLIVSYRQNLPVYLHEVATIEDGLEDFRKFASFNGQPAVGLGLMKISGSNTVAIIEEVKRRLNNELLPDLPPGIKLNIVVDDASFIQAIISGLKGHLYEGTILAALVVWLFLTSLRSTVIVATAIPVSLLGAITAIYFIGYTFNVMTMLGLLLLIGVVVDDAIVVLENIYRHMEENPDVDPTENATQGTNQVMFAILASTLTLVSLFGAVAFMEGIISRFIGAFAVVVIFGVVISLIVSVTLTPMLCARYLRIQKSHGRTYQVLNSVFEKMDNLYQMVLGKVISSRVLVIVAAIAIVYSSGWFMSQLGKEFMPAPDQSRFLVTIKAPLGSSIDYTRDQLKIVEELLKRDENIYGLFSTIGAGERGQVNQGEIYVSLKPKSEREMHQTKIVEKIRADLATLPGVQAFATAVPSVGGLRGEPLQFVLKGPSLEKVAVMSDKLREKLQKIPAIGPLDTNLQLNMPELKLIPNREKIKDMGLDPVSVGQALRVLVGGMDVAKYNDEPGDGERYPIRLKAQKGSVTHETEISRIYLRNQSNQLVRLDNVVDFESGLGAASIGRYNLQYAATFYATPKIPEGDAAIIVLGEAEKLLPSGYQVELIGRAKSFSQTAGYIKFAFLTGMILIYMTLASQFNSFIQPFIVMVAQPLAVIGGVFALWMADHSLNIYSMIGLVLLVGLVAKNSILLIDLTNQLRDQGRSINEALLEACPIRLRPVLMTSLTVILTMIPAAVGMGEGSETNAPLAVAVIGGMISSTLLTLVAVPAVYSLVEHGLQRVARYTPSFS